VGAEVGVVAVAASVFPLFNVDVHLISQLVKSCDVCVI